MRLFLIGAAIFCSSVYTHAQLYISADAGLYHMVERAEIKTNDLNELNFHSSSKPYRYIDVSNLAVKHADLTRNDSFNLVNFKNQSFFMNPEFGARAQGFLSYFYKQNAALYSVQLNDFVLSVNPVLYFSGSSETGKVSENSFHETLYINTRGAELQGVIDNKISFYAFATDNQMRVPLQTKLYGASAYALPGESFYKNFKGNGVDFFHAEGYVSAPITKHIDMQFGSSKQFIGDGMRSLILSDFSKQHLFLKLNTKIWKINNQNLFYELVDSAYTTGSGNYKKKFGATHHLSINLGKRFNLGFFETVIFKRDNNAYELNYLNPIIFYRAVEHSLGSPDNVLLGLDYKLDLLHHLQVYGQIVLDEFYLAYMRTQFTKSKSNREWGWWGNKYALQLGLKYIDILKIKNLDIQLEYNHIRPYTYSYTNPSLNFTDFNQSMAHPLGANLKEFVGAVFYQPTPALKLQFRTFSLRTGIDTSNTLSYGSDLLKSSYLKRGEFGNATAQGLPTVIVYYELSLSYRVAQQLYIDAGFTYRNERTSMKEFGYQNQYFTLGLRLNSIARNLMY